VGFGGGGADVTAGVEYVTGAADVVGVAGPSDANRMEDSSVFAPSLSGSR
jgi:hypothetical protein